MPTPGAEKQHMDGETAALASNIAAVLAVSAAVEGTLGPKGLDTLLVDRFGDVLVTNSGVAILERMDVSHPAARMLVHAARSQHEAVGDGTTTAAVMAGAVLKEGLSQISRGVPVTRLLEGIRQGACEAVQIIGREMARPVEKPEDPRLLEVAFIAGRGDRAMAALVAKAAAAAGREQLLNPAFQLSGIITAREHGTDRLVEGAVISKGRISPAEAARISPAKILALDDSLMPEEMEEEALRTESGFRKSLELKNQFLENLQKIISLGVNLVLLEGGIHPEAEEILTRAGVAVIRRINSRELAEVCAYSQAEPLKRSALNRDSKSLQSFLGRADRAEEDPRTRATMVTGGKGRPRAAVLLGAGTRQVAEEKERKAKDAAASLQAAFQAGVVPGGGTAELAAARVLEERRSHYKAMTSYGLDCVIEGLRKPFLQMAANAGFNPLEKAEEVLRAQRREKRNSVGMDFETGKTADMEKRKILDPAKAKVHALAGAAEVSQAILRINRILKMRENGRTGDELFSREIK